MPRRYLVTSGLPYSNGRLHVGHIAGAYLPADIYVRYLRACGREVCFVCGSDDNGVAIEISAMQSGKAPQEVCSHYHERQKRDFAGLGIQFDVYGGTHQPGYREIHERLSQEFFRRIHEKGYFSKRRTQQLYDPAAGRFLPDRYVRGRCHHPDCGADGATGDQCDECGRMIDPLLLIDPVSVISGQRAEVRETTHWYLRLSEFEQPLKAWLESKRGHWRANVLNFALGQIRRGLPERAMTRDIDWGVPVPLDDPEARRKVLFVWFDAPIGYISFTAALCARGGQGQAAYARWWCAEDSAIVHFIGEDNTVFHALIWPAMLMAEGRHQLPWAVVANNFVNIRLGADATKVSKSQTPADSPVWIEEYLKKGLDPEALRYHLTAIAPESARTSFEPRDFVLRHNSELADNFGNFVNRTLKFARNYLGNRVPPASAQTPTDHAHLARGRSALARVGQAIEQHRFRAGLEELMAYSRLCNEHFNARQPWRSRREDPADCAAAIATCIHAVQYLAVLAQPFLPRTAARLGAMLGAPELPKRWLPPPPLPADHPLGEPEILFGKLEPDCMG